MYSLIEALKDNYEKYPEKIIFDDGKKHISNSELYENALHVASSLIKYKNKPIIIEMNKSCDLIIAMMGVVLSGNFYTILDTKMPIERKCKAIWWLHKQSCTINEDDVTEDFSQCDGNKGDDDIRSHQSEGDGDGAAEHGEKGKESHPRPMSGHKTMGFIKVFFLHMEVFLNPLHPAHPSHAVVHNAA